MIFLINIWIYGSNVTLGFHYQKGTTMIDDQFAVPKEALLISEVNKESKAFFFQCLYELGNFCVGFEFGVMNFYNSLYTVYEPGHPSPFLEITEYNPNKLLIVGQYKILKYVYFQAGLGTYFGESLGSKIGSMASIRFHVPITKSIEVPLCLKYEAVSALGTPSVFSIGIGFLIRMDI